MGLNWGQSGYAYRPPPLSRLETRWLCIGVDPRVLQGAADNSSGSAASYSLAQTNMHPTKHNSVCATTESVLEHEHEHSPQAGVTSYSATDTLFTPTQVLPDLPPCFSRSDVKNNDKDIATPPSSPTLTQRTLRPRPPSQRAKPKLSPRISGKAVGSGSRSRSSSSVPNSTSSGAVKRTDSTPSRGTRRRKLDSGYIETSSRGENRSLKSGPFFCPHDGCLQVCYRKSDLQRHLQTLAHAKPRYPCSGCGRKFPRPDPLKRHIKRLRCPGLGGARTTKRRVGGAQKKSKSGPGRR